jgi:hypothetical protein
MNTHYKIKNQNGAVLVISLLILLVLTLIGVSSLEGSAMEEKMASNSQTATNTFQKAESSIQEAFTLASRNPAGAVKIAGTNPPPVDHSDVALGINSETQLVLPPGKIQLYNNSAPNGDGAGFVARKLEIIGEANIGDIGNTNTQGYRVFPLMQIP